MNLLMIVEFRDVPAHYNDSSCITSVEGISCAEMYNLAIYGRLGDEGSCDGPYCDTALFPRNDVHVGDWWLYVVILLCIFTVFRVLSAVVLTKRAKATG